MVKQRNKIVIGDKVVYRSLDGKQMVVQKVRKVRLSAEAIAQREIAKRRKKQLKALDKSAVINNCSDVGKVIIRRKAK